MKSIKKLLVIRLSALGDICMTLPVIDSFCRAYPDVQVTFVTSKPGAAIANAVLRLDNLIVHPINKKDYSGLLGANRLYKELKAMRFDAVADLHSVLRTILVDIQFRLAGCPVRTIDKGRDEKKELVSHSYNKQLKSGIQRYKEVFEAFDYEFDVDYDGKDHRLDNDIDVPAIGIAPFAQHKGKIYPIELMKQVVETLIDQHRDLRIYLFGGPEDTKILQTWADANPERVINVAGKQTFAQDLALMSGLKLMVSMDSANMHLASLVGLRCLSIWGATHIHAGFLGYNQSEDDVIDFEMSCRPCSIYGNKPCKYGDYRCLSKIEPQSIVNKILKAL